MTTYMLSANCISDDQSAIGAHAGESFARVVIGLGLQGIQASITVSTFDDAEQQEGS